MTRQGFGEEVRAGFRLIYAPPELLPGATAATFQQPLPLDQEALVEKVASKLSTPCPFHSYKLLFYGISLFAIVDARDAGAAAGRPPLPLSGSLCPGMQEALVEKLGPLCMVNNIRVRFHCH